MKITVDTIIFANSADKQQVLLIKRRYPPFKDKWAIPGGFVEEDETLEAAALRELQEETGLSGVPVEQLYTFGDPGRDPRGRTITIVYMAVLSDEKEVRGGDDAREARWFAVDELPPLAFDHDKILKCALDRLKALGTKG